MSPYSNHSLRHSASVMGYDSSNRRMSEFSGGDSVELMTRPPTRPLLRPSASVTVAVRLATLLFSPIPAFGQVSEPLGVVSTPSEMLSVGYPLTVYVQIWNTTSDTSYMVDSAVVELPEPLVLPGRRRFDALVESGNSIRLDPQGSVRRRAVFEAVPFHTAILAALGYRCADHRVTVRVWYHSLPGEDGRSSAPGELVDTFSIRPRSGLAAVIVGGVLGVLLATILAFLHGEMTRMRERESPGRWLDRVRTNLLPGLLTFLYGSVVTAVAIYLLDATTVPGFPVSIALCDPLGGLIIGLFFKPIGGFIQAKISGEVSGEVR